MGQALCWNLCPLNSEFQARTQIHSSTNESAVSLLTEGDTPTVGGVSVSTGYYPNGHAKAVERACRLS